MIFFFLTWWIINEFENEYSQYDVLKETVRARLTRQSSRPDAEKIKKDVRGEVEEEFRKKLPCSLQVRINIWNQEIFCA